MTREKIDSGFLSAEAKRLMDFRKQHVTKNDLTPCPQCATLVKIQAVKCPQCTSDISGHTQKIREELQKLSEVTAELNELHKKEMELFKKEAGEKPIWNRIRDFFSEPALIQDMKIVLPFLIGLFALILFLRNHASGLVFLLGSIASGFAVYFLFEKWKLIKYVAVDLYRTVLLGGMLVILSSATLDSANFWPSVSIFPEITDKIVNVNSSSANIRQAPNTNSKVLMTVTSGEKLTVLEKKDSWYEVRTESGLTGWVYSNLVN